MFGVFWLLFGCQLLKNKQPRAVSPNCESSDENSDSYASDSDTDLQFSSNHEACKAGFSSVGYTTSSTVVSPLQIGVPETRRRLWYFGSNEKRMALSMRLPTDTIGLRKVTKESIRSLAATEDMIASILKQEWPLSSLQNYLLDDDDMMLKFAQTENSNSAKVRKARLSDEPNPTNHPSDYQSV